MSNILPLRLSRTTNPNPLLPIVRKIGLKVYTISSLSIGVLNFLDNFLSAACCIEGLISSTFGAANTRVLRCALVDRMSNNKQAVDSFEFIEVKLNVGIYYRR
jgi:hypothetical protein